MSKRFLSLFLSLVLVCVMLPLAALTARAQVIDRDCAIAAQSDPHSHDCIYHEAKAPTCTECGWEAYQTCSLCGYSTYVEIPALGHDHHLDVISDATRYSPGSGEVKCSRCNEILTRVELPALNNRDYAVLEILSGCTSDGLVSYTWINNEYGTYKVDFIIPARGHDYRESLQPDGRVEHKCSRCGDVYYTFKPPVTPILGDANGDGEVTIIDAGVIQRYLASLNICGAEGSTDCCDINGNGTDILDVTLIQRHLAGFASPYPIAKPIK